MKSENGKRLLSVMFVLPNLRAGGAERVSLTLLSLLDRNRFAPELVVFEGKGEFSELQPDDIPIHDLGVGRLRSALLPLLRLARSRRPDVIFSSHGYVNLAVLAGRSLLPRGTRIVVREPSTPSKSLPDTNWGALLNLGYHVLFRRADSVICLNREAKEDFVSRFGVQSERLTLLPNPVAVADLRRSAEKLVRDSVNGRQIVAAGRLTRAKGFDNLLRALKSTPDDIYLTIYGEGPERESLTSLCQELQLGNRVRFAGFENRLGPALAGADAVVAPSRWEGFPNIVLESLACGTPVISTPEAGGVGELVDELEDGALILAPTEQALIAAITSVRKDSHHELRESLLPDRLDQFNVTKLFADTLEKALN